MTGGIVGGFAIFAAPRSVSYPRKHPAKFLSFHPPLSPGAAVSIMSVDPSAGFRLRHGAGISREDGWPGVPWQRAR